MNAFDGAIVEFVLKHISRSYYVSYIIQFIAEGDNLFKGGVFAILIWYLWFKYGSANTEKQIQLLSTLFSILFVMAFTLGLAVLLPFRSRPILNPLYNFSSAGPEIGYVRKLSSFPSDHAALFISLSTGFWFLSRKIGLTTILFSIIFILFPRLYLGFHYPSDLLAGSLIGAVITGFFNKSAYINNFIRIWIVPFVKTKPAFFYLLLFLVTYEIADLFAGSRDLLSFLMTLLRHYNNLS
jgi:membrane-associated phospholipid phosphatase